MLLRLLLATHSYYVSRANVFGSVKARSATEKQTYGWMEPTQLCPIQLVIWVSSHQFSYTDSFRMRSRWDTSRQVWYLPSVSVFNLWFDHSFVAGEILGWTSIEFPISSYLSQSSFFITTLRSKLTLQWRWGFNTTCCSRRRVFTFTPHLTAFTNVQCAFGTKGLKKGNIRSSVRSFWYRCRVI